MALAPEPEQGNPAYVTLRLRANVEIFYLDDGSVIIKPQQMRRASHSASRPLLREALQRHLPTCSLFDAFCLDYFPNVYQSFSASMDRVERTNILFTHVDCDEILAQLRELIGPCSNPLDP